jgi:rubrerythrin
MPHHSWEVISTCASIERTVAGYYFLLSKINHKDHFLSRLLKKTGEEEENHERQFLLAAKIARGKHAVICAEISLDKARSTLETVINLGEVLSDESLPPVKALEIMIDLEEKLSEFHAHTAVSCQDDSFSQMFKAMMANDNDHVEALERHLERLKRVVESS